MKRTKLAPTLRKIIDTAEYEEFKQTWVAADREYRAIVAVVRTARKVVVGLCAEYDGAALALDRALARLDAVSASAPATPDAKDGEP